MCDGGSALKHMINVAHLLTCAVRLSFFYFYTPPHASLNVILTFEITPQYAGNNMDDVKSSLLHGKIVKISTLKRIYFRSKSESSSTHRNKHLSQLEWISIKTESCAIF